MKEFLQAVWFDLVIAALLAIAPLLQLRTEWARKHRIWFAALVVIFSITGVANVVKTWADRKSDSDREIQFAKMQSDLAATRASGEALMRAATSDRSEIDRLREVIALLNRDDLNARSKTREEWKRVFNESFEKRTDLRAQLQKADEQLVSEYNTRWTFLRTFLLADFDQALEDLKGVDLHAKERDWPMFAVAGAGDLRSLRQVRFSNGNRITVTQMHTAIADGQVRSRGSIVINITYSIGGSSKIADIWFLPDKAGIFWEKPPAEGWPRVGRELDSSDLSAKDRDTLQAIVTAAIEAAGR